MKTKKLNKKNVWKYKGLNLHYRHSLIANESCTRQIFGDVFIWNDYEDQENEKLQKQPPEVFCKKRSS